MPTEPRGTASPGEQLFEHAHHIVSLQLSHIQMTILVLRTLAAQVRCGLESTWDLNKRNLGGMPGDPKGSAGDTRHRSRTRRRKVIAPLHFPRYRRRRADGATTLTPMSPGVATAGTFCAEADPELMIVPALDDYHQHHRLVAEVALNPSTGAANSALTARSPPPPASTVITSSLAAAPFAPDLYGYLLHCESASSRLLAMRVSTPTCKVTTHGLPRAVRQRRPGSTNGLLG